MKHGIGFQSYIELMDETATTVWSMSEMDLLRSHVGYQLVTNMLMIHNDVSTVDMFDVDDTIEGFEFWNELDVA